MPDSGRRKKGSRLGGGRRGSGKGGTRAGPGGECKCTSCGHRIPHETGKPCTDIRCPKCGSEMVRAG